MRYQGGKSRIAKPIAQIIMQVAGGDCFVSLFCGSCAVESKVQGFSRKLLNDRHEYLIAMLQGVQQGYNLPEHITLEQYRYIRENKDADPVLAGFVGFGCSFGGKWFGGLKRTMTSTLPCVTSAVMTSDRLRTSMMRWMPKKPLVGVHAKTRMGNGLTFAPLVSTRLPHLILEVSYEKSRDIGCRKGLCLR